MYSKIPFRVLSVFLSNLILSCKYTKYIVKFCLAGHTSALNMHDMQTKAKSEVFDATLVKWECSETSLTNSLH